jgi:hypothetical protein
MNWKERILSTIKGEKTDCLPFVPRLDIWYKSNRLGGTLPREYKGSTLSEIVNGLDVGCHSVVPDFSNFLNEKSKAFLGLGIYDLKNNPYKIVRESMDFKSSTTKDGLTSSCFYTPYGNITTQTLYNDNMKRGGATIGHTVEHALKSINDIEPLGYIFENIKVQQNYNNFNEFKDSIGDRGVGVGFCMLSGSPTHHIMKELMPFEKFVYMYNDNPGQIKYLSQKIEAIFDKVVDISSKSSAEILFCGANYDSMLTWPSFFKENITPWLKKYSDVSRKNNKFFLTHADGENDGLLQEYIDARIDIADSICPSPMTKLKIEDIRKKFDSKITIWGGLPSICVLEDSVSDYEFEKYSHSFFKKLGSADRIILSFADTTPPGAKFERIKKIASLAKNFKL